MAVAVPVIVPPFIVRFPFIVLVTITVEFNVPPELTITFPYVFVPVALIMDKVPLILVVPLTRVVKAPNWRVPVLTVKFPFTVVFVLIAVVTPVLS